MIECLDEAIRPLVLIVPKVKYGDKNNKLMSIRIDDAKLLEKYRVIWANIEDLKLLN